VRMYKAPTFLSTERELQAMNAKFMLFVCSWIYDKNVRAEACDHDAERGEREKKQPPDECHENSIKVQSEKFCLSSSIFRLGIFYLLLERAQNSLNFSASLGEK
jgi:hypothetical protein